MLNCKFCNKEITNKQNIIKTYCSRGCSSKQKSFDNRKSVNCLKCGKEFKIIKSSNKKYCSVDCAGLSKIDKMYNCKLCNKEYKPNNRERVYCSKQCVDDAAKKQTIIKICKMCNINKLIKGQVKSCTSCYNKLYNEKEIKRAKARYQVKKIKIDWQKRILVKMAGGKCCKCGYSKCLRALSFHHIDDSSKLFTLDKTNLMKKSWEQVLDEFSKCELLCANCHAYHHGIERSKNVSQSYIKKRNIYINNKLKLINTMGGLCSKCYISFDAENLQVATFHHLENKSFSLDSMAFIKKKWVSILEESKKCQILCFNCHMEVENELNNNS